MHRISLDVAAGNLALRFQEGTTPHLGSGSEKMKQPPPLYRVAYYSLCPWGAQGATVRTIRRKPPREVHASACYTGVGEVATGFAAHPGAITC